MRRPRSGDGTPGGSDDLVVDVRTAAGATVLTLRGELDIDTADLLHRALDAALAVPGTVVVIDCGDLAFCDSTGLSLLLRTRARAADAGSRIELARPRPMIRRMLELTGAADAFPIRDAVP